MIDGLRLAWGTLTAIPGPAPRHVDARVARVAMLAAPAVVLPLTVVVAMVGYGLTKAGLPALAAGLLTLGALQWATNGIHADGLADTADGLGSGRDATRSLEIMRRGDIGPLGATALLVVLGAQAALLGDVLARPWGWLPAAAALAAGRLGLALGCRAGVPAARADGLGTSVAGSVPTVAAVLAWLLVGLAGVALAWTPAAPAAWAWPAGVLIGGVLAQLVVARAIRRLGGITGDVLGALVEVTTLGVLLGLAAG